ncbi:signal peptidase I [Curtobacterium flaccumfaciens]|uniref:signal peptidase I n=1 Tax=Curtobacterium flaccumfaciens TaxID=2035 RepID=UPI001BDF1B95|nr:signal peptidase I [Curtobacterium flaccumfaciens]MBT1671938.1 signal peptidase I [Curtobacterium flaccumfaciens pv. flaccumfaciens]
MTSRARTSPARHRRRSLGREIRRLVGRGAAWTIIVAAAAALLVAVVIPTVAGGTALTVLTGSMRPGMPPGTLLVIRPAEPSTLRIGDVVTYQIESGKPAVVTHRIVGVSFDGRGHRLFTTRGDANGSDDPRPVRAVQIKGEKWYSIPHLGWVNSLLSPQERGIGRLAIAAALFVYALWMLIGSIRGHRTRRRARQPQEGTP